MKSTTLTLHSRYHRNQGFWVRAERPCASKTLASWGLPRLVSWGSADQAFRIEIFAQGNVDGPRKRRKTFVMCVLCSRNDPRELSRTDTAARADRLRRLSQNSQIATVRSRWQRPRSGSERAIMSHRQIMISQANTSHRVLAHGSQALLPNPCLRN